jgi:hypothetical protein
MRELHVLREIAPETVAPTLASVASARATLLRRIETAERRAHGRRRLWALPAAGAVAAASVAAAAFLSVGSGGEETANAAVVLRRAAAAARAQSALEPGEYLYVKSVDAYLATSADDGFSVLVPHVRELWLGLDGGRLHESSGEPIFLSDRDRQRWIEAGRPELPGGGVSDTRVPARSLDLPSNVDALWRTFEAEARRKSAPFAWSMFQLVGDALRETVAAPAQRAALFEVAARIPGVRLEKQVVDEAGRAGIAVGMDYGAIRFTLVIDPETYDLFAEEQSVLPGNAFGYAPGTVIGHATYLASAIVDSPRERPSA